MIKRTVLIGVLVLAIVACSDDSSTTSSSSSTTSSSSSPATASSSSTSNSLSSAAEGALAVKMNNRIGQEILVNSEGRTLYLYEPDGTSATSTASAGLKSSWPPVTGPTATVGAGLDAAKAKSNTQPDGTTQLSYNGHLLYQFSGDPEPGDANGQGLGGVWFVLSASGDKISA